MLENIHEDTPPNSSQASLVTGLASLRSPILDYRQLAEVPPASAIPVSQRSKMMEECLEEIAPHDTTSPQWSKAIEIVRSYSSEMVERWNKEIDVYLVFAGLFSAILTAFNVQSYQLLQPASTDLALMALQKISSQLSDFSPGGRLDNSPPLAIPLASLSTARPTPHAPLWAVQLNILWFSGLIISLASSVIAIMSKQWLNEYSSGISGRSDDRAMARLLQHRLNNLQKWRVGGIITAIPILLLISLGLFLTGVLVLLWQFHSTVAIISSALVGLLGTFTLVTTFLPLFATGCAYRSPQMRALYPIGGNPVATLRTKTSLSPLRNPRRLPHPRQAAWDLISSSLDSFG
ncbi:hypothetical protein C8Q78DRAFT_1099105 [Trametes maxima]|nr:hypothetical protein C8Q78DRAFT_1099105 [Trametes maxima]